MKKSLFNQAAVVMMVLLPIMAKSDEFHAYYTRLDFEDRISGKYADIVVSFGKRGQFVFGRESSYLPYWQTGKGRWFISEIVPRSGNGPKERPDLGCWYSHVRLIEESQDTIIIHWRYMPDLSNVEWDGVVDEYFTLTSDLKVFRTIRRGMKKLAAWNDPANLILQTTQLNPNGIQEVSRVRGSPQKQKEIPIAKAPVRENRIANPVLEFPFDEAMDKGDYTTLEVQNGIRCTIEGHKTLWKTGVSGTTLGFDGYYSTVRLRLVSPSFLKGALTVEGWVALGAYPFDWAPVVHQSDWGKEGFYLGVNEDGYPGFHATVGNQWISVVDSNRLELFGWHHIAGVHDIRSDQMRIFVNGQEKSSRALPNDEIQWSNSDVMIGLNNRKMPAVEGRIRKGKWPSLFGIDGLIDEVRVYDRALSPREIAASFLHFRPPDKVQKRPDLEERHFPVIPENVPTRKFGAHYTKLEYYETWDNLWRVSDHPDVVVTFDELPTHIVIWRGLSYGPTLVTENGKWAGDQSSENYRELDDPSEAEGSCEHMSDKQCRHSHVRIIENTDARVVVHWRYGLVDSRYVFVHSGHDSSDWADEYWTIYPDGAAVRHLARGKIWGDSWVETMFFSEPGSRPEDNVRLEAYTLVNMEGESQTYSWERGSPECDLSDPIISLTNMRSAYKPFNIYPTGSEVETFPGHNRQSHFHWWNHWPVSQITSDGRSARAADRAAHSSLVWGIPSQDFLMYGTTNAKPESLIPLAKSWNDPPTVTETNGCELTGYRQEERAYHLRAQSNKLSFTMKGTYEKPIVNPCFVVANWRSGKKAVVKVDGKVISSGKMSRQGIVWDTEGKRKLVVFLKLKAENRVTIDMVAD